MSVLGAQLRCSGTGASPPTRQHTAKENWPPLTPCPPPCQLSLVPTRNGNWWVMLMLTGLILRRQPQQQWINAHIGPFLFRGHCFFPVLPDLWLLRSFPPIFQDGSWPLKRRSDRSVPFVAERLFSALWCPFLSLDSVDKIKQTEFTFLHLAFFYGHVALFIIFFLLVFWFYYFPTRVVFKDSAGQTFRLV